MAFGIIDTSYVDLPSNIDAAYLRGLETRSGLAFADLVTRIDGALATVNSGADPLVAAISAPPTSSQFSRSGRASNMTAKKKNEYSPARPQQVERAGWMLPIDEIDIALGFTEDGLMEISLDDFVANVDAMQGALERAFRADHLYRLFNAAEIPIDGTTSTSPGFAGSGTGANVFSGIYPDGTVVASNLNHYLRDTTANRATLVKAAQALLKKWYRPPYDLVGSTTFIDAVTGLTDFVQAGSPLIRLGSGANEAVVDPNEFVGVYNKEIRVWYAINDFTEDNAVLFKTFGNFSPDNAVVMRWDPLRGRDAYVRSRELFPLDQANAMWKYGVGVNNRTAAVAMLAAASGSYVAPAITY